MNLDGKVAMITGSGGLVPRFGGVHPVGWQLVGAAGQRFNLQSIKMIEWHAAFAYGVAFFDGLGDVGFCERRGFDQSASGGQLRGQR